jgi:hypothetical protein
MMENAAPDQETCGPIDLVYTYVDSDRAHEEKRQRFLDTAAAAAAVSGITAKEVHTRFFNVGEIRYSVRSALRAMPWIRRIFIVTDAQTPPVDRHLIETGRVQIVDHCDIIPAHYLPTFNAVTIESFLHRIEGLSEIYLYNNDDFFHFAPVPRSEFFEVAKDGSGQLLLNAQRASVRRFMHLTSRLLPARPAAILANSYTQLISNACVLLHRSRYQLRWRDLLIPRHFTNIYRIQTALRLEAEFAEALDQNRKGRFVLPGCFGYSTLFYTLERLWNPGTRIRFRERLGEPARFGMYDFTALGARNDRVWRRIASSRLPFACLNNIPFSDRGTFEQVMRAKGLGNPCDDFRGGTHLMQKAD